MIRFGGATSTGDVGRRGGGGGGGGTTTTTTTSRFNFTVAREQALMRHPRHRQRGRRDTFAAARCCASTMVRRRSVPPKIFSNVEGTWAHDTVSRRLHEDILERVFVDDRNRHRERRLGSEKDVEKVTRGVEDERERVARGRGRRRCDDVEIHHARTRRQDEMARPSLDEEFYFYRRVLARRDTSIERARTLEKIRLRRIRQGVWRRV